jgi:hypothetical protein
VQLRTLLKSILQVKGIVIEGANFDDSGNLIVQGRQPNRARHDSGFTCDSENTAAWFTPHSTMSAIACLMRIALNTAGAIVKRVHEVEREEGREEAINKLLAFGMTPEQISRALKLPLDTVQRYLNEQACPATRLVPAGQLADLAKPPVKARKYAGQWACGGPCQRPGEKP